MKSVFATIALLIVPCLAAAQCYSTHYAAPSYASSYTPNYYPTPALVAVIPAVFVPTASYTVGLSAPVTVAAATTTTTTTDIKTMPDSVALQMLAELKAMRAESKAASMEIKQILNGGLPSKAKPPEALPSPKESEKKKADAAIKIMTTGIAGTNVSCASCHNPNGKNGGLVAFNASLEFTGVSEEEALAIAKKVSAEKVCPKAPGALTGADKETVLDALPPVPRRVGLIRRGETAIVKN